MRPSLPYPVEKSTCSTSLRCGGKGAARCLHASRLPVAVQQQGSRDWTAGLPRATAGGHSAEQPQLNPRQRRAAVKPAPAAPSASVDGGALEEEEEHVHLTHPSTSGSSSADAEEEDTDDGVAWASSTAPEAAVEDGLAAAQAMLPEPTKVTVTTGRYLTSSVQHSACPAPSLPEFAVIGRSNVGKSSMINMLTGLKALALVSKEPGKTRCINHFLINNSWFLVDLPGYGYARRGRDEREKYDEFTKGYFTGRPNLVMVLLLVDACIAPQPVDLEYAAWMAHNGVPFAVAFTKADKRRRGAQSPQANAAAFLAQLSSDLNAPPPPFILTSAHDGRGKRPLLRFIASLRVAFERSGQLVSIARDMAAAAAAAAKLPGAAPAVAAPRLEDLGVGGAPAGSGAGMGKKKAAIPGMKKRVKKKSLVDTLLRPMRVRPPRAVQPNADDEAGSEEE